MRKDILADRDMLRRGNLHRRRHLAPDVALVLELGAALLTGPQRIGGKGLRLAGDEGTALLVGVAMLGRAGPARMGKSESRQGKVADRMLHRSRKADQHGKAGKPDDRPEERRVGKESGNTGRS